MKRDYSTSELGSNISSDVVLRANKTGAFMKTKPQNNDLGGLTPLMTPLMVKGKAKRKSTGDIKCFLIEKIGIYLRDSYDFRGKQSLGYWNEKTNYGGKNPFKGDKIRNVDFRAYKIGADFIIFSDVKVITLTPKVFVNVDK